MGCAATTAGRRQAAVDGDKEVDEVAGLYCSPTSGGGSSASTTPPSADSEVDGARQSDAAQAVYTTPSGRVLQPRPLTDDERKQAWTGANYFRATSGQAKPIALWLLGPSSVGKSTLAAHAGHRFDIPLLQDETSREHPKPRKELDAVIIDGEYMRDVHGLWKEWVSSPDWHSAYPALKSTINMEKDSLMLEAAQCKKHVVVPQTCLKLSKSLADMEDLARRGYQNHIFAVVAPLADCQRRGKKRETETGKRYQPLEYEQSIEAIPPMVMEANGRYEVVRAIERPNGLEMDYEVIEAGNCREDAAPLVEEPTLPGQPGQLDSVPAEGRDAARAAKLLQLIRATINELT